MMHKKLLTLVLALTLVSSATQVWTITYPSENALKKADHIASLVMTGAFAAAMMQEDKSDIVPLVAFFTAASVNVVINGMALKYKNRNAAFLKLLLPAYIIYQIYYIGKKTADGKFMPLTSLFMSMGINVLKNVWDVYSLVRSQPVHEKP